MGVIVNVLQLLRPVLIVADVVACLLLILLVLLQSGRGGGIEGLVGGSNTLLGSSGNEILATWTRWAATAFFVLTMFVSFTPPRQSGTELFQNAPVPVSAPAGEGEAGAAGGEAANTQGTAPAEGPASNPAQ